MRKSILKDGAVVNVVEIEDGTEWTPPDGCTIGPEGGEIGDVWAGGQYARPSPPEEPPRTAEKSTEQKLAELTSRVAALEQRAGRDATIR